MKARNSAAVSVVLAWKCGGKQLAFSPQNLQLRQDKVNWTQWRSPRSCGVHQLWKQRGCFLILSGCDQTPALLFPQDTSVAGDSPSLWAQGLGSVSLNLRCVCPFWVHQCGPGCGVKVLGWQPLAGQELLHSCEGSAEGEEQDLVLSPSRYHRDEQSLSQCWNEFYSSRNMKKN